MKCAECRAGNHSNCQPIRAIETRSGLVVEVVVADCCCRADAHGKKG